MKGNVFYIVNSKWGIINGADGKEYFFHKTSLLNCTIYQLSEGDYVSFDCITQKDQKRDAAIKIRKLDTAENADEVEINAGIKSEFKYDYFNEDEIAIINLLKKVFYVTNGGNIVNLGNSNYRYCLVKPTSAFTRTFNLKRELIVVFSDYVTFEPRSLDAAAAIAERMESKLRVDRGCQVLISSDINIEKRISEVLKDTNLNSIVIPFSYQELLKIDDLDFIINRFRKYLFDVDLFSSSIPIQEDIFFFGRRDYVYDIANKCKNNVHCGIFGLRRSGKTSLLYAVKRLLENDNYPTVYIPCQSQFANVDWGIALYNLIHSIISETTIRIGNIHSKQSYQNENAAICFEDDLNKIYGVISKPIVLLFDEIESITFGVSGNKDDWKNGIDYVTFWNAIRGYYSKYHYVLSIVVAGTNPMINEIPVINEEVINPMFGQLSVANQGAYLPPFTVMDTNNMINTLGGYMGLSFDDKVCSLITADCGGHPYLIRLLCSYINTYIKNRQISRPQIVTETLYTPILKEFEETTEATGFYLMILNILISSYPKEFNALKEVALNGDKYLSKFVDEKSLLHLLGYGLLESDEDHFRIRFKTIERYLLGQYKFERANPSIEEQKQEIQFRINNAEMALRRIVKSSLQTVKGATGAKRIVIDSMASHKAISPIDITKAQELTYNQLFDPSINKIYFSVLIKIIIDNYDVFKNLFDQTQEFTKKHLDIINTARRVPDHSYTTTSEKWSIENFYKFREAMSWLETITNS